MYINVAAADINKPLPAAVMQSKLYFSD